MATCLKIKSARVQSGKIDAAPTVIFKSDNLRLPHFSWNGGTAVGDEAFA